MNLKFVNMSKFGKAYLEVFSLNYYIYVLNLIYSNWLFTDFTILLGSVSFWPPVTLSEGKRTISFLVQ